MQSPRSLITATRSQAMATRTSQSTGRRAPNSGAIWNEAWPASSASLGIARLATAPRGSRSLATQHGRTRSLPLWVFASTRASAPGLRTGDGNRLSGKAPTACGCPPGRRCGSSPSPSGVRGGCHCPWPAGRVGASCRPGSCCMRYGGFMVRLPIRRCTSTPANGTPSPCKALFRGQPAACGRSAVGCGARGPSSEGPPSWRPSVGWRATRGW